MRNQALYTCRKDKATWFANPKDFVTSKSVGIAKQLTDGLFISMLQALSSHMQYSHSADSFQTVLVDDILEGTLRFHYTH